MPSIKCRYNGTSTKICSFYNEVSGLGDYLTDVRVNGVSFGIVKEYPVTSTDVVEFYFRITDIYPNDVFNIPKNMFYGCDSLVSVEIGADIVRLSGGCFYGCSSLSEITIKNSNCEFWYYIAGNSNVSPFGSLNYNEGRIASGGTLYYPTGADYSVLLGSDKILGILGWNGVEIDVETVEPTEYVIDCRFRPQDGSNGTAVTLEGKKFKRILLNGVDFPYGDDFVYIYDLTEDDVVSFVIEGSKIPDSDITVLGLFNDGLVSVSIPEGITEIGTFAFSGKDLLESIILPESLEYIGESAFKYTGLKEIVIPNNVVNIDDQAFYDCTNLKNATIGNGVTHIGLLAFANTGLESIVIPDNVVSLSNDTSNGIFSDCKSLTSAVLGNGLTYTSDYMFIGCTSLTNVVLGNNITTIGLSSFAGCTSLTTINIPSSVTNIDHYVFQNSGLKEIHIEATIAPEINKWSFIDVPKYGTLYYPEGSDYSQWLSDDKYYLGYYEWNGVEMDVEDMPDNPEGGGDDDDDNDNDDDRPDRVQMSGDVDFIKCDYEYLEFDYTGEPSIWITITWVGNYTGKRTGVSHSWIKIGKPVVVDNTIYRYPVYLEQSNSNTERSGSISFAADKIDGSGMIAASLRVYQTSAPDAEIHPFKTSMKVDANGKPDYASDTAIRCGYTALAVVTPVVDGDWINLGTGTELNTVSTYDIVMEYPISFDANTGGERTGTITFMGLKDNGTALSEVCVITQAKNPNSGGNQGGGDEGGDDVILPELPEDSTDETFSPIWKDVEYVFGGSDVTYGIYQEQTYRVGTQWVTGDVLIYKGRAYAAPNESAVKVNINKVCQNFMTEPPSIFNGAVGFGHSFNTFKLKGEYGNVLHTYHFINDWSYKELTLGLKTNPIVPYIGDGQQLFFSALAQSQKAIQWGMRYYDGTSAYNNTEYISNAFKTNVVANSRRKNVRTFYFGNKYFEVLPLCSCKYVLYYLNPYGGYDWFPITGRVLRRDKLETYTVTQNYNNTTSDFGKKRYLSTINITYQINTQWLTQEQSDRMWELLESNQVWIHSLEDDKVHPVIITDTDVEHKQKTNSNRMISYQINLEHSQTRERV